MEIKKEAFEDLRTELGPCSRYILTNGLPTAEPDYDKWTHWFMASSREWLVGYDNVGDYNIITSFTGIDLGLEMIEGKPILWTTRIVSIFDDYKALLRFGHAGPKGEVMNFHKDLLAQMLKFDTGLPKGTSAVEYIKGLMHFLQNEEV